jgi:hypothetical protein
LFEFRLDALLQLVMVKVAVIFTGIIVIAVDISAS